MSHDTKQDELARKARQVVLNEQRVHETERANAEEELRHTRMLAKTKALRELRLAREAAGAAAAELVETLARLRKGKSELSDGK